MQLMFRPRTKGSRDNLARTVAIVSAVALLLAILNPNDFSGQHLRSSTSNTHFETSGTRGSSLETTHFNITCQSDIENMLEMQGETLEEAFEGVTNFLNFTFSNITQVIIGMDPNIFPGVNLNIGFYGYYTDPWPFESGEPEIHLSLSPEWSIQANDNYYDLRIHVATHEFMHVALSYLKRDHNVSWHVGWLEEGLGTYYPLQYLSASDEYIRYFIHNLLENDELRDIQDIPYSHPLASGEGYTIIKYMIDEHGRQTFLDFLDALRGWNPVLSNSANQRAIFPSVFGKTLDEFNDEWKEWLTNDFVPGIDLEEIEKVPGEAIVNNTGWSIPTSGKKGKLVWVSDQNGDLDIFVSNEDGTEERLVTSSWGYDGDAEMDSSADWVAFTSVRDGNYEIYKIMIDGDHLTRLTDDDSVDIMGSWSSNGEMAFTTNRNGDWDIFVMESNGSDVRELIATGSNEGSPVYSPKGDRIAFNSNAGGNFDLYVADSDGSNIRQLTFTPENESFPSWSPDGKKIAYTLKMEYTRKLMIMDIKSGSVEVLFEHPSRAGWVGSELGVLRFPEWSSGGNKIFVAYAGQVYSVELPSEEKDGDLWIFASVAIGFVAAIALVCLLRKRRKMAS